MAAPELQYQSGLTSVGYAALQDPDGTWRAEVRIGHVARPPGEKERTEQVPDGPWASEEQALDAAHTFATNNWHPTPGRRV